MIWLYEILGVISLICQNAMVWVYGVPWCGCMEHGLEYIMFYVKKYIRDGPLGVPAFVKIAYYFDLPSLLPLFWV